MMLKLAAGAAGFSVTEVTTVLAAMSILSGASAPAISEYVEDAKAIRVRHDVRTLAITMMRLANDTGAESRVAGGWATYDLLVGAGAAPAAADAATHGWTAPIGETVGLLDDQLIQNTPQYTKRRVGGTFGWRGAYLQEAVAPDPWGFRYAVNVGAMRSEDTATVVLSTGVDGTAESSFATGDLPTRGDDIVAIVSTGRRTR